MKKTMRSAMLSTIAMLVVAVLSLTGVTYAWFSAANQATVGKISMTVDDNAGGIEIATTFGEWKSSVDAPAVADEYAPVSTTAALTGNALSFFEGTLNPQNKNEITTTATNSNYLKFTLYFRNNGSSAITMDLTGTNIVATATENNDIDKALRIGFVEWNDVTIAGSSDSADSFTSANSQTVQIYEPNATAHTANGLADGATEGQAHAYKGVTRASGTAFNRKTDTTNLADVTTDKALSDVTFTLNAGTYKKVDIYVWIEGQDADCQNDVSAETFDISFVFKKVEAQG